MRDGLVGLAIMIVLMPVGHTATQALAAYGTVTCCLEVSIDGAPPRQACIVLNVRSRAHPKARARWLCRVLGGRPRARVAA
jgi:hypothetical protein